MSNAVASARKRRAGIMPEPPTPTRGGFNSNNPNNQMQQANAQQQSAQGGGLTLQQVISLINTRLLKLEKYMNENIGSKSENVADISVQEETAASTLTTTNPVLEQIIDEYNHRFNMFSEEIATLKDTIMKLQTFTMEVNKTLYDERIQILSDMGSDTKDTFLLNEPRYDNEYMASHSDDIESQILTIENAKLEPESESKEVM